MTSNTNVQRKPAPAPTLGLLAARCPSPQALQKAYENSASLWRLCSELMRCLPEWMDGPFPEIDAEVVATESDKWWRGAAKLAKQLEGPPLEVVMQVRHGWVRRPGSCGRGKR
eukprot:363603-Chlamydomonas_euryale.AAC.5